VIGQWAERLRDSSSVPDKEKRFLFSKEARQERGPNQPTTEVREGGEVTELWAERSRNSSSVPDKEKRYFSSPKRPNRREGPTSLLQRLERAVK